MTHEHLLDWGAQWNYPFLAISKEQPLRHGKEAYEAATPEQIALASVRIDRWNEIVAAFQVNQAISIVDKMLISRGVRTTPEGERV